MKISGETNINPKIAIYGVGFVGATLTKLVHSKGWQIVAAYNRAGEKVGQDLGSLVGLNESLGVIVEDAATADIGSCGADIALVAAGNTIASNFDGYKKFLSAGINVLCHASEAYSPRWTNAELASELEGLASENNVTFTGGGIWDMTRIRTGLIVAGPCVEIESFEHDSSTEIVRQGVQFLSYFAVGKTKQEFDQQFVDGASPFTFFHIPGAFVLEKTGYTITTHKSWIEPIIADESVYCPEADLEIIAGRILGARLRVEVETKEGVTAKSNIDYRVFRPGEIEEMRWRVNGKPGMEINVIREDSGLASAASLFNRIPDVLAARPGIVEICDMSLLRPSVHTR